MNKTIINMNGAQLTVDGSATDLLDAITLENARGSLFVRVTAEDGPLLLGHKHITSFYDAE